jgi:hypothetical protein
MQLAFALKAMGNDTSVSTPNDVTYRSSGGSGQILLCSEQRVSLFDRARVARQVSVDLFWIMLICPINDLRDDKYKDLFVWYWWKPFLSSIGRPSFGPPRIGQHEHQK